MLSCDRIESAKFIHDTPLPAKSVYYTISSKKRTKKDDYKDEFNIAHQTSPGGNTPQDTNYTATSLLSQKL